MSELLHGASALAGAAIALWFLRFWRESGDRLFLAFSVAFLILGANRIALGLSERESEDLLPVYGFRLAAFIVIIAAIVDRNRR